MQQLQIPPLTDGETYIGAIGDKNGEVYHVILLPSDKDCTTWKKAMNWAKKAGGDLPNRIEQSMLWANHRDLFKKDWYWSNETHHIYSTSAWYQGFLTGNQTSTRKDGGNCRARAVRRLPI